MSRQRDLLRDLATVSARTVAFNLSYLAGSWFLILTSIVFAVTYPHWPVWIVAFLVVSSRQQALLNLSHECLHGLFVDDRRWNLRIGAIFCAYPCGSPFFSTRIHHLAHHRLLGTGGDPDAPLHRGEDKRTPTGLLRYFALGLGGGYAVRVLVTVPATEVEPTTRAGDRRNLVIAQIVLAGLFTASFGIWAYPCLWLAPLLTVTTAMHLVRSYCEHALVAEEEAAHADRLVSIRSNPVERFIVAPYFMNYHAEHHLFPWIPAPNLPEVHRRLSGRGRDGSRLLRRGYLSVVAEHVSRLRASPQF